MPRIFADFHNADEKGRIRLNCTGTIEDLGRQKISLSDGQMFTLYSEDIEAEGIVQHSPEEKLWIASIDWEAVKERRVYPKSCQCQAPAGVRINRDSNEEIQRPKYTCCKIYMHDEIIGVANYRLFDTQFPYWYIDELIISEQDRERGFGTYLLCYVIAEMWKERKLPIHIYPTGNQIPKDKFIEWLVHRDFVPQPPLPTGQVFYILFPDLE